MSRIEHPRRRVGGDDAEERHQWMKDQRRMERVRKTKAKRRRPVGIHTIENGARMENQAQDGASIFLVIVGGADNRPRQTKQNRG